tara:strand:- start:648 stop:2054 length:1407 start_codon:yes stop_codon:yes gene_type:complete
VSTASLLAFLNKLDKEFERKTPKEKRLEYNLLTHTFTYDENTFLGEMESELQSRGIRLTSDRRTEIQRLAGLFSTKLYTDVSTINQAAEAKSGITRLKGTSKSFSFVFTTDVRTGKTPNGWAQGQADVFDKIKVSYSNAYRNFFFGIRRSLKEGTKARESFDKNYRFKKDLDTPTKGRMGHSGHAEGEGIVETMTREFFEKHASTVFNAKTGNVSTEQELLSDLDKMGIDLTFMRSTSDMTQNISLIGASGNILSGNQIKKKLEAARNRIKKIINKPGMLNSIADLEGSDSLKTIKRKQTVSKVTKPFKKIAGVDVKTEDINIQHSTSTVSKKKKSKGKKGKSPSAVKVAGLSSLSKGVKAKKSPYSIASYIGIFNQQLPQAVARNMISPALQYQSGRFAASTRITDITQTAQGFPSIGYTYMRYPYETFEVGNAQGSVERDPRKLIDKSIREIATQFAIGRFYTRRV